MGTPFNDNLGDSAPSPVSFFLLLLLVFTSLLLLLLLFRVLLCNRLCPSLLSTEIIYFHTWFTQCPFCQVFYSQEIQRPHLPTGGYLAQML